MIEAAVSERVYIIDDDVSVRDSLCAFFSAHEYRPVAFSSAEDFLSDAEIDEGLCVIVDLRMPGIGGIELHRMLTLREASIPVVILTAHGDVPLAVRAMKRGALDFLEKPASEKALLGAVEAAKRLTARAHSSLSPRVVSERLARLTSREKEVLDHLILGMTNKHIADELGISQRTVEIHRARIREKMEARGLSDLIGMMR